MAADDVDDVAGRTSRRSRCSSSRCSCSRRTFFPVTAFHGVAAAGSSRRRPLYRGVVLCRELTTGVLTWASAVSVVYLVVMGLIGLAIVRRRLDTLLLT